MWFQVNSYLILIVQFLVSVGASFAFGYLAPFYLTGQTDVGPRLLIGVLMAFVVGIADLYFVIRQMLADDGIQLAKKLDWHILCYGLMPSFSPNQSSLSQKFVIPFPPIFRNFQISKFFFPVFTS
jgi:hypothetical protein